MGSSKFLTPFLKWGAYSRFESIRTIAWKLIEPKGEVFSTPDSSLRILVGGDVSFDREIRFPLGGVYRSRTTGNWFWFSIKGKLLKMLSRLLFSPRLFSSKFFHDSFPELRLRNRAVGEQESPGESLPYAPFNIPSSIASEFDYPLRKIAPLMQQKDVVLVNLETPLTNHSRVQGNFICDPQYAHALKDAGVSIVNLANNHIFDVGDVGFSDTLDHLEDAGIPYIGGGRNIEDARLGRCLEIRGVKICFLGYTNFCNKGFVSVAAEYPGVVPLDPRLIVEDIHTARKKADFVFITLHWGSEDQPNIHPRQREVAHALIDAGADAIVGHHPHIPHGIEIYRGKPILYSLGNLIFGFSSKKWSHNYVAEIVIDQKRIQGLIIYPVSGRGQELFQPEVLSGARADSLLHELQIKSVALNTAIAIRDHIGYIKIKSD